MIRILAFLAFAATSAAAQDTVKMLDLMVAECLPSLTANTKMSPMLERASPGVHNALLNRQSGSAWTTSSTALVLFEHDSRASCGVYAAGMTQTEFYSALTNWSTSSDLREDVSPSETARVFYAQIAPDAFIGIFALSLPLDEIAVLNALRLEGSSWAEIRGQ